MKSYSITSPKEYGRDSKCKKPLQYMVLVEGCNKHRESFTANPNCTPRVTLYSWTSCGLQRMWLGSDTQSHSAETHFCHAPMEINHTQTGRAVLALTYSITFGLFFFFLLFLSLSLSLWASTIPSPCKMIVFESLPASVQRLSTIAGSPGTTVIQSHKGSLDATSTQNNNIFVHYIILSLCNNTHARSC